MVWYGAAIGAVIGGGLGEDEPSVDSEGSGLGGAKNANSDDDCDNGGQGLFSLWGREIWLYVGGIAGWGDGIGLYVTTGPMIGKNPDWAIGGGIHFGKTFGFGVVLPIRNAIQSYNRNQDKVGAALDYGSKALEYAQVTASNAVVKAEPLISGLEQVVSNIS